MLSCASNESNGAELSRLILSNYLLIIIVLQMVCHEILFLSFFLAQHIIIQCCPNYLDTLNNLSRSEMKHRLLRGKSQVSA